MTALNQNGDDFQLVNATNDGDILVTASGTTADIILDSTRLVELDGGTTISLAIAGTDEATITAGHILVKSTTPLEFGATSRHINDDGTHISMVNTTVGGNIYLDAKSTSELKIDGVTFLNIQSGSFRFQGGNEIRAYRTGNTNYASITKGATNDLTILEATGDIAINTTAANGDILLTASGTTADIILDSTRKVELDGGTSVSLDIAGTPVMTVAAALVKSVQEVEIENSADTPLLLLDQDHATSEFIKFEGTVQADDSGNISTQNGDGAVTGPKDANAADGWTFSRMVKVDEGGTEYWVPLYVNDPAA